MTVTDSFMLRLICTIVSTALTVMIFFGAYTIWRLLVAVRALRNISRSLLHSGKELRMSVDDLRKKVEATQGVVASAVTLIQGLAEQLRAVANDPAAIQKMADQLDASNNALAAAVAANTPADPAPVPVSPV